MKKSSINIAPKGSTPASAVLNIQTSSKTATLIINVNYFYVTSLNLKKLDMCVTSDMLEFYWIFLHSKYTNNLLHCSTKYLSDFTRLKMHYCIIFMS